MSVVALVVGVAGTLAAWPLLAPTLARGGFERTNRRGRTVVTTAGLTIVLTGLAAGAVIGLLDAAGVDRVPEPADVGPSLLALVGFGILGLVDDVLSRSSGGVRGHVAALAGGEITGGMVKLAGGAAVGVVVASYAVPSSSAAGVVARRRPRRPRRQSRQPARPGAGTHHQGGDAGVDLPDRGGGDGVGAQPVGVRRRRGAIGLLVPEMRERCMLGDTGANADRRRARARGRAGRAPVGAGRWCSAGCWR